MATATDFLAKFKFEDADTELLEMAKHAEAGERYEDMCIFMGKLVENTQAGKRQLSVEERNLLSVAYKNVIGARRASWRTISVMSEEEMNALPQLATYKKQIEAELQVCSDQVLGLLKNILIPNCEDDEAKVFYLKMSGDYNRYLAEAVSVEDYGELTKKDYEAALAIAEDSLESTHPVRLGLALNFSVCHYEILKNHEAACNMAKTAFDQAISKLDKLQENDYKDSTLIMQLLRDNLTLWTSQDGDDDGDMKVEDFDDN